MPRTQVIPRIGTILHVSTNQGCRPGIVTKVERAKDDEAWTAVDGGGSWDEFKIWVWLFGTQVGTEELGPIHEDTGLSFRSRIFGEQKTWHHLDDCDD